MCDATRCLLLYHSQILHLSAREIYSHKLLCASLKCQYSCVKHFISIKCLSTFIWKKCIAICDRICEKVPFSHIKCNSFSQLSNFVTFVSQQARVCNFPCVCLHDVATFWYKKKVNQCKESTDMTFCLLVCQMCGKGTFSQIRSHIWYECMYYKSKNQGIYVHMQINIHSLLFDPCSSN